jgi:class 3 adenylate cyclase
MGVHTGSPVVDDDDVGLDVHRAARICSAAHGGQVLVSAATRGSAGPGDLAFEEGDLAGARELLATLAAREGETERVVRLLAGAAAIRGAAGAPLGDHQQAQLARAGP